MERKKLWKAEFPRLAAYHILVGLTVRQATRRKFSQQKTKRYLKSPLPEIRRFTARQAYISAPKSASANDFNAFAEANF